MHTEWEDTRSAWLRVMGCDSTAKLRCSRLASSLNGSSLFACRVGTFAAVRSKVCWPAPATCWGSNINFFRLVCLLR